MPLRFLTLHPHIGGDAAPPGGLSLPRQRGREEVNLPCRVRDLDPRSITVLFPSSRRINFLFPSCFLFWKKLLLSVSLSSPIFPASFSIALPTGSPQAPAGFALKRVRENPFISQRLGSPPCGRIQNRACVFCPVRAKPVHFQREPIVQISGYRAAYHGHTAQMTVAITGNREFVPRRRLVVPMVVTDKFRRIVKIYRP